MSKSDSCLHPLNGGAPFVIYTYTVLISPMNAALRLKCCVHVAPKIQFGRNLHPEKRLFPEKRDVTVEARGLLVFFWIALATLVALFAVVSSIALAALATFVIALQLAVQVLQTLLIFFCADDGDRKKERERE